MLTIEQITDALKAQNNILPVPDKVFINIDKGEDGFTILKLPNDPAIVLKELEGMVLADASKAVPVFQKP